MYYVLLEAMKIWTLVFLLVAVYAKHETYKGWKSYNVTPKTLEELKNLGSMLLEYDLDFLSNAYLDRPGLVLVKPQYQDGFTFKLEEYGIEYSVHSPDVKAALEMDDVLLNKRNNESLIRNNGRNGKLSYDKYHDWPTIEEYLRDIAETYPDIVTLVTAGESFEGRPLIYLKISTTNFEDTSKHVVFIDGGIHAREWISPPTVTWAIHKLVEDLTEPEMLEKFDWILFPVVNPDGYQFTFTGSGRMWRKTRSTVNANSLQCPGVDGNRNYDFFWNTAGTSNNPCMDNYAGAQPFSEAETRAVRDIVRQYIRRMTFYVTMHSYGSMILYPWGHDGSLSTYAKALQTAAEAQGAAIDAASDSSFPRYKVGNSVAVIGYPASGASEDWAHIIGVPLAYTYELPSLNSGIQGFVLDPIWIEQVCKETWEGIRAGALKARELFRV